MSSDAANLGVIHLRRRVELLDVGDHIESRRLRNVRAVQRNCLQIVDAT